MAACEDDFQDELKEEVMELKGKAIKLRHWSLGGVLDILWKRPDKEVVWVECKYNKDEKCAFPPVKTTAMQKFNIREWRKVGVITGWALCHRINPNEWRLYVGIHENKKVSPNDHLLTRRRGESWDINKIETQLTNLHKLKEQE